MKTKQPIQLLIVIIILFFVSCKKDDFNEIIVPCPSIESVFPSEGASEIGISTCVSITFNMDVTPDQSCHSESPIILTGNEIVNGEIKFNGRIATLTPYENLKPGTTYSVKVSRWIRNSSGIPLSKDYQWNFTTSNQ